MIKIFSALLLTLMMTTTVGFMPTDEAPNAPMPLYLSITGTVSQMDEYLNADGVPMEGWRFIQITDNNGDPATILTTDETHYTSVHDIRPGDQITGFYSAMAPMPLIYPPQYNVKVLVAGLSKSQSVKVDQFNVQTDGLEGYFVSKDGMLAFKVGESTEIRSLDGELFDGNFDGLHLAVIYDVSTRSIPAQTVPVVVIVIY